MNYKNIAQLGYEAYSKSTNNKNFRGDEMPKFDALPEPIVNAWIAAAEEIVKVAAAPESLEILDIPLTPCNSSMCNGYGYDAESQTLAVEYNNRGVYHYKQVSPEEFEKIEKAESKGKMIGEVIKSHQFKKVK